MTSPHQMTKRERTIGSGQLALWERADKAVNTANHNINVAGKIFNQNVNTYNEQVRAPFWDIIYT